MRPVTLVYCLRNDEVLLGEKIRGFGKDTVNGYGGKVREGESIVAGAKRELFEESGISSEEKDYVKVAEIDFYFAEVPKEKNWDQTVHVYTLKKWSGEPVDSEEMRYGWYPIKKLPIEKMWVDDEYWLPYVFDGKKVRASFTFKGQGGSLLEHKVEFVDSF